MALLGTIETGNATQGIGSYYLGGCVVPNRLEANRIPTLTEEGRSTKGRLCITLGKRRCRRKRNRVVGGLP